jgi:anti-sigma B factor antagonist
MSCTLTTRQRGDIIILDSVGRITLGEGAKSLKFAIRDLVAQGKKKIILNLAETSYVDSSGLGEMVFGFTCIADQGGTVKLLALGNRVKHLLQMAKLYTVFETFDNEDAAVRSFEN